MLSSKAASCVAPKHQVKASFRESLSLDSGSEALHPTPILLAAQYSLSVLGVRLRSIRESFGVIGLIIKVKFCRHVVWGRDRQKGEGGSPSPPNNHTCPQPPGSSSPPSLSLHFP